MTKAGFWKTDWFLGVAVVISVVLFNRLSDLVPSLERKAYDLGVIATSRAPSDGVAPTRKIEYPIGIIAKAAAALGRLNMDISL